MSITASSRRKRHRRRLWQLAAAEFFIICFASCSVCFLLLAVYLCQKTTQLHGSSAVIIIDRRDAIGRAAAAAAATAPFIRAPMDFSYFILFYIKRIGAINQASKWKMKEKKEFWDTIDTTHRKTYWKWQSDGDGHPHDQYIRLVFKRKESTLTWD